MLFFQALKGFARQFITLFIQTYLSPRVSQFTVLNKLMVSKTYIQACFLVKAKNNSMLYCLLIW